MRPDFDAAGSRLDLVFEGADEVATYLENLERRGLLLVRLPEPLQPGHSITVRLRGGDVDVSLPALVHQVFRSGTAEHGVALKPQGKVPELTRSPTPAASADPSAGDEPPTAGASNVQRTEMSGAAIALEIRRMNVSQKMRLATRAGRLERQILLRDNSPQVLMSLLANPRIDETEVRDLVRSPHAASGVLQQIAKDRRWSSNYEVRLSLVRNPKTPTPLAQRILPTLRKSDLQTLAKSSHVREAIKGAALRLYLGKI
jgi:hypothetical protein